MSEDEKDKASPINVDVGLRAEAKLNVDVPDDVTRSMSEQLLGALSPFTESLALMGDKLRLRRQKTLLNIAIRAKELAAVEAIDIQPVSEKFLAHFLERASLEEPDSPLIEKWSKLLVSASQSHSRNLTWCIRVLDEIDPHEALVLEELYRFNYPDAENYTRHQAEYEFKRYMDLLAGVNSENLSEHLGRLGAIHYTFLENDVANFNDLRMTGFEIGEQLLHLESMGLVWAFANKVQLEDQLAFIIQAVLTPLGMYFVGAVSEIE